MKKIISIVLAILMILSMSAFSFGRDKNQGKLEDGTTAWYLGGDNLTEDEAEVIELFDGIDESIDPASIYSTVEYTEEMLHGCYVLNDKEKDLKKFRKEIPFEDVDFANGTLSLTVLPTAVFLGTENMSCTETDFAYGEFRETGEDNLAVIEFSTKDQCAQMPCTFEVAGDKITFEYIRKTNDEGEALDYEKSGIKFQYEFRLAGPNIIFTKGEDTVELKAYCFTENTDSELWMSAYSTPGSPLINELDNFGNLISIWTFGCKRDGSYYDRAAFRLTDDGVFTVCLEGENEEGESEKTVEQYAYIVSSNAGFLPYFGVTLFDGEKVYSYTDTASSREERILTEAGVDTESLSDEELKNIAEKKSDLFDQLYDEFKAQGVEVTIDRSTGEIAMDASALFGGDSAVITEAGKELIDKFLAAYTSIIYNEDYEGFISKPLIEGHIAPQSGITYEEGLPLSQQRAEAVREYCLSSETGTDSERLASELEAVGMSNSKPVYDNDGNVDIAASRRVSFTLIVDISE